MLAQSEPFARQARRLPARIPVRLILDPRSPLVAHTAFTVDISPSGARVRADVSLSPGQAVNVVPNEGTQYAIPGRVVWVNEVPTDPGAEAGIEFS